MCARAFSFWKECRKTFINVRTAPLERTYDAPSIAAGRTGGMSDGGRFTATRRPSVVAFFQAAHIIIKKVPYYESSQQ